MAHIGVRVNDEELASLDRLAKTNGVSRAGMMRALLFGGVKHPEGSAARKAATCKAEKKCPGVKHRTTTQRRNRA